MEKLVLVHWESDDATYCCKFVLPILYESLEKFKEDIKAAALKAIDNYIFELHGQEFHTDTILEENFEVHKLEDWFNKELVINPPVA